MTLYRVARYSKVIEALIKAAENGKEAVAAVEKEEVHLVLLDIMMPEMDKRGKLLKIV